MVDDDIESQFGVYSGLKADWELWNEGYFSDDAIIAGYQYMFDMPLSAIADTLLLPITIFMDPEMSPNEKEVVALVERFLAEIGRANFQALPEMFCANANIGSVTWRDGKWQTKSFTFEEFLAMMMAMDEPPTYVEPVSEYSIHIEPQGLAFVRANATLIIDGEPYSNNLDYFTLIKEDGEWKFLSASYVAIPFGS